MDKDRLSREAEVTDAALAIENTIQVLKGLSLSVPKGAIVALLGSNGAGKTTTLKAASGLLSLERGKVVSGRIALEGEPIGGPRHRLAPGLAHVPRALHLRGSDRGEPGRGVLTP
jgi:branched-chain amino acid transport system ATP-binding protein